MKVIVVGCTHAGTAFTVTAKKLYGDKVDITIYEKNDTISFLSCGIALHVGGVVKNPEKLFYSSPKQLSEMGANPRMKHEVIDINTKEKWVLVKNLETGETFKDNYDKLLISSGSWPIIPNIPGVELEGIKLSKNFYHARDIINYSKNAKRIAVIGAGYIGVELAEAFKENGKEVMLFDIKDRILSRYLDREFTDILEAELKNNGVELILGEKVVEFKGENNHVSKIITDKGEYNADMVVLAMGFKPNTELFKGKVEMLENGAIKVDKYLHTSENDLFAVGDSAAVWFTPTNSYEYIPLATNAVRMGTIAAYNLFDDTVEYKGTQGTSGVKVYSYNVFTTGLSQQFAEERNLDVKTIFTIENNRPEFMPEYEKVYIKIVYDDKTKRILGGQIMSKANVAESINTLSLAISNNMTLVDLAFSDFFFQPHFNKPWNFLNTVALKAIQ